MSNGRCIVCRLYTACGAESAAFRQAFGFAFCSPGARPFILREKSIVVSSANYRLFERAMRERKQVHCRYNGYAREVCPIILGHSQGEEKVLTDQFGGQRAPGFVACRGLARALVLLTNSNKTGTIARLS